MPLTTTRRRLLETALPIAALGALSAVAELARARTEPAAQRMPVLFVGRGSPMARTRPRGRLLTARGTSLSFSDAKGPRMWRSSLPDSGTLAALLQRAPFWRGRPDDAVSTTSLRLE